MSAVPTALPTEIVVTSPGSGRELGRVPVMDAAQVRAAVAKARAAQGPWAELPVKERVRRVRAFRDLLLERQQEIVDLVSAENGKTKEEVVWLELMPVATIAAWYLAKAPKLLRPQRLPSWGPSLTRPSYLHHAPLGVVAVISPWNYPFSLPLGPMIPALLAGNGVVLKPSEWTPLIGLKIKEIYDRSGLPRDLFQVVTGFGPTGQALIEAGVDKVDFTGSVAVGKRIGAACGERLIPFTLELGGKAPAIVCDDADLDRAANTIAWGGFANCGQTCTSVERVLVHETVAAPLTERIVKIVSALKQGDPSQEAVDIGAVTFPKQIDVVERLVEDAKAKGAKVLTGGQRLPGPGRFYAPTVLGGVTPQMDVARQEIFGPVVPIISVSGDEEAIRIANDSHLGLNAYVFSRDRRRARRLAERIQAGTIAINDTLSCFSFAELPFGGVKESGLGRIHGAEGLWAMCQARGINRERLPSPKRDPWNYPYSPKLTAFAARNLKRLARALDLLG